MSEVVRIKAIVLTLDTGQRKLQFSFTEQERARIIQQLREAANRLEKM